MFSMESQPKPSFATITGKGDNPKYNSSPISKKKIVATMLVGSDPKLPFEPGSKLVCIGDGKPPTFNDGNPYHKTPTDLG